MLERGAAGRRRSSGRARPCHASLRRAPQPPGPLGTAGRVGV